MKIVRIGLADSFKIYSDQYWSNGTEIVLGATEWASIEGWCKRSKIYYEKSGNTIRFFKGQDATAFVLRWS